MKGLAALLAPLLLLARLTTILAPACPLPTTDEVREGFNDVVNAHFRFLNDHPPADVHLFSYYFDCRAAGSVRDTYRSVAVTGIFLDLGPQNRTVQIDLICLHNSVWAASLNYTNVTELRNGTPSTNCASCEWRPDVVVPTLCTGKSVYT